MNRELLFHFFECYFHQDWRDDYSSSFEALRDFCCLEPERKAELRESFNDLLEQDALSENFINEFGGSFKTEREGLTANEWLKKAISDLK
ncbi:contact-dependent growth inhibition system immunity protein [Enterovibrio norvegicus]|uniref:contact-dependent growth inhibition system immunity protein n=1 Tax=Enterovibrio norvegicus TaxID=188144 RepID=UPI0013CFF2D7|nr:contact-dependent growth inhibition system immunity protein [Enterovibrio norvegicus]